MLTESEARELLAEAAATIEVPPGEPVVRSPRRSRYVLPAAAAAAVAVLLVGVVVALDRSDPSSPVAPTAPTGRHGSGVVPSVFGFDAASATRLLQDAGLTVETKDKQTCDTPGRAVRTRPSAGTPVEPGDTVTLIVTKIPPAARCMPPADASAWELLDFANGRGPAPAFADEVSVYLNGKLTTLTGAEAADPSTWRNSRALGALAVASSEVQVVGDNEFWLTPRLTIGSLDPSTRVCGGPAIPADLADPPPSGFVIAMPTDAPKSASPCTFGAVAKTDGRVDAIVVRSSSAMFGG